jgi:nucleoside phosphorylase
MSRLETYVGGVEVADAWTQHDVDVFNFEFDRLRE